jgi:hypothetical protein
MLRTRSLMKRLIIESPRQCMSNCSLLLGIFHYCLNYEKVSMNIYFYANIRFLFYIIIVRLICLISYNVMLNYNICALGI